MAFPITVEPSLKLTVPEGVPMPPVTVAVNVTDCASVGGLCEGVTPGAQGALCTVALALVPALSAAAASVAERVGGAPPVQNVKLDSVPEPATDRKSTRLNSSHVS